MALGEYFILKDLRDIVDIDDTVDDPVLKTYGKAADDDIEMNLSPVAQIPLTGTLLSAAKRAALFYVASMWKLKKGNRESGEAYERKYKSAIESMITLASLTRTERTKRVSVSTDYRTRDLFSQQKRV